MPNNAPLVWDESGARYFEAGVSSVALYPMTDAGAYGNGVAWSGVTAINENPSGADATDLYADNIKYATLRSAEKFGFTIEAYQYPPEWAECDGSKEVTAGVYLGQQGRKAFGLAYKTQVGSDTDPNLSNNYKLHIIYNSTASPSSRGYATINENPDAISMSWEATSTQVTVGTVNNVAYKPVSTIVIDTTKLDSATKTKLEALEKTLFGSTTGAATLPTPAAVIAALTGTTTQ